MVIPGVALASGQVVNAVPAIEIEPSEPVALLSAEGDDGVPSSGLGEETLARANATTLVVSLVGATWEQELPWREASIALLAGLRSTSDAPHGWNAEVAPRLTAADVTRRDGITATIALGQFGTYSIAEPETLRLEVPSYAVRTDVPALVASPSLVVAATPGELALNGTLLRSLSEVTLGGELDVHVLYDELPPNSTAVDAEFRRGFVSAQAEAAGWNAIIQPALGFDRRGATRLSIEVTRPPAYEISAPETLLLALPMRSGRKTAAALTLAVLASPGSAALTDVDSSYLEDDMSEADVRGQAPFELQITITGDKFRLDVGDDSFASTQLLYALNSLQNSPGGWNNVVRRRLSYTNLRRIDDTTIYLTVPQCAEYDISEPETIDVELPGAALVSAADARLTPAFPAYALIVRAEGGSAGLDGTLLKDANVATVQSPVVSSLTITLRGDEFSEDVVRNVTLQGSSCACESVLPEDGTAESPLGWNGVVRRGLLAENLLLVGRQTAIISVPQFARYSIVLPETIRVVLPAAALQCCGEPIVASPSFIIQAPTPSALFGGTLLKNVDEAELRSTANYTLSVTLTGDAFVDKIGMACEPCDDPDDTECEDPCALTAAMLASLVATSSADGGWNNIVRGALSTEMVTRTADDEVLLTLPAFPEYEVQSPETITLTLPGAAVKSKNRVDASPAFRIRAISLRRDLGAHPLASPRRTCGRRRAAR